MKNKPNGFFLASLLLSVRYPENYPDEAPDLDLLAPQNAAPHPYFDFSEDRDEVMASLSTTIEENLGMAMIFTVAMSIKDIAETLIRTRAEAVRAERQREKDKAEELENEKFNGTMVTRERFLAWSAKFKAEIEEAKEKRAEEQAIEDKKKRGPKEEKKMTGRELWERGLIGKVDEDEFDDADNLDEVEGVSKLQIAA
jgi:hypothetical protein